MLDFIKIKLFKGSPRLEDIKERLSKKGLAGSFILGVLFALAFCPFSAVLFFGMLIPLAMSAGDGLIIPSVFAIATGLPVIIFSLILVYGVSKLGKIMNKVQLFERWVRKCVSIVFIIIGMFYTLSITLGFW
jgi:threonine/homoserine/homoserine lactone efflux protein